ncbi:hypothetical protein GO730_19505 [Spirosoma sp. HMF3257]|nr:hypothetical protein [Spirosoma telluris]
MNATLLKKVEELTLYGIEQDSRATKQEVINQQLRSEVDELKQLVNQLLEKK